VKVFCMGGRTNVMIDCMYCIPGCCNISQIRCFLALYGLYLLRVGEHCTHRIPSRSCVTIWKFYTNSTYILGPPEL
jgi:hypothetical protein